MSSPNLSPAPPHFLLHVANCNRCNVCRYDVDVSPLYCSSFAPFNLSVAVQSWPPSESSESIQRRQVQNKRVGAASRSEEDFVAEVNWRLRETRVTICRESRPHCRSSATFSSSDRTRNFDQTWRFWHLLNGSPPKNVRVTQEV